MNPVLIILILIGGALLWLLCSFIFIPLGKVAYKLIKVAEESISREEKEKEEV